MLKEAKAIYDKYMELRTPNQFQDAVIAFLYLFARAWMESKKTK